jgi:purine-binding chemotaxis protein CheW
MSVASQAAETSTLFASFSIGEGLFAMDTSAVQEIMRLRPVTPVRHAAPAVLGVINLRGRIVTLFDTSLLLGFGKSVPGAESRIFVIEDRDEFVGLLVDRVKDVIEIGDAQPEPLPTNIAPAQAAFFKGVCREQGKVIAILDVAAMLAAGNPLVAV